MRKWMTSVFCLLLLTLMLGSTVFAALPSGAGMITSCSAISGSAFSKKSSIAKKLDKMFAGNIGLYADKAKTKLVDAALGTRNVPNNGKLQYWADGHAGTSCFAYANAFYATFYDGLSPHDKVNGNHQRVKATGKITYQNFVKWGVRNDAAVYIREGNHSVVVLHYDENYLTYIDGNGDAKGLIAIRKEPWKVQKGSNIYNQRPSLIVQPKTSYFAPGSMGTSAPKSCTEGGTSHDWNNGKITKQANCLEKGEKTYTCNDCKKTKTESIAKTTKHTYGPWTVTKEATCGKKGAQLRVCTVCGKENTQKISPLGHDYGPVQVIKKMTLSSPGLEQKTCSRCQDVMKWEVPCATEDREIGLALAVEGGVFPEDTTISFHQLSQEDLAYALVEKTLGRVTGKFTAYQISADANGELIQPEGFVTLRLNIPEDFGGNIALYAVTEEGTGWRLQTGREEGVLTCQLNRFTYYALCDLDVPKVEEIVVETQPETQAPTEIIADISTAAAFTPTEEPIQTDYLLLAGVVAVTVSFAVCVLILVLRERRKHKEEMQIPID